ncbi:MAG: type II toxin-antitoxin system VapC family toxin [Deltaproteobacteria bacterium]|nr:MAG: type II toxin-antitoxin system VapC family toxin [Deltaproteobacteria bacterium]
MAHLPHGKVDSANVRPYLTSREDDRLDQGPDRPSGRHPAQGRYRGGAGVRGRAHRPRRVPARAPRPATERGRRGLAPRVPRQGVLRPDRIGVDRRPVTYLVDANVLSEATRPTPDARAVGWLRRNEREIAVDPIILGEIRFGILLLPRGRRRQRLERWFDDGVSRLTCLPWDASVGLRWAKLLADLRTGGRSMPVKDSLIAATALAHGLVVVTRNRRDFESAGVRLVDPFTRMG